MDNIMVCGVEIECQIVDGVDLPSQKPLFNTLSLFSPLSKYFCRTQVPQKTLETP